MLRAMSSRLCAPRAELLIVAFTVFGAACSGEGRTGTGSGVVDADDAGPSADAAADAEGPPVDPEPDAGEPPMLDAGVPEPPPPTTVQTRYLPTHALEAATSDNPAYADARNLALMQGYG